MTTLTLFVRNNTNSGYLFQQNLLCCLPCVLHLGAIVSAFLSFGFFEWSLKIWDTLSHTDNHNKKIRIKFWIRTSFHIARQFFFLLWRAVYLACLCLHAPPEKKMQEQF